MKVNVNLDLCSKEDMDNLILLFLAYYKKKFGVSFYD